MHAVLRKRVMLDVPYEQKNEAKELGAWWDPDVRKWFIPAGKDPKPFSRWLPKEEAGNSAGCSSS